MAKFLSLFCLELQKLLKPIYDLARKSRQFIWDEEQQNAFDVIERSLQKHQYYIYQIIKDSFIYIQILLNFSQEDTLYQIKNGKPKLIVYLSKRLLEAAQN